MKVKKIVLIFLCLILTFTGIVYAEDNENLESEIATQLNLKTNENNTIVVKSKVIEAGEVYEETVMDYTLKLQKVRIEILDGEYKGQTFETTYSVSYDLDGKIEGYPLTVGTKVNVQISTIDDEIDEVVVQDIIRSNYIAAMLIVFFIIILIVGRKQGLKAILAFVLTIIAIFTVMLQSIMKGHSAIVVSILVSVGIIIFTFIIIAGFNRKSYTAMLGTIGGVLCAGIMAAIFGVMAKLSGGQEESIYLSLNSQNLVFNFKELLFAGIIIASLGACMDVGMSIASALDELKQKNPNMTGKELFKSGMNIGSDVIGTMTNTLILAYVGGAINLVLLFMVNNMSLTDILNNEMIATDAISAIAASMGVIFTVPITAIAYAVLNNKKRIYDTKKPEEIEGKRTLKL